jgi:hypothetical protein
MLLFDQHDRGGTVLHRIWSPPWRTILALSDATAAAGILSDPL